MGAKLYIRYLDDTFRDKAFCHMIIIQEVLLLALCYAYLSILVVMPLSIALTRWYDAHREGLQMAALLIKYGSKLYSHFPNGKSILKIIVEDLHIVRSQNHPHEMCKAFYRYTSMPTR